MKLTIHTEPTEGYPSFLMSMGHMESFGSKWEKAYGWEECAIRTPHSCNHIYLLANVQPEEGEFYLCNGEIMRYNDGDELMFHNWEQAKNKIMATTDPMIISLKLDAKPISPEDLKKITNLLNDGIYEVECEETKLCTQTGAPCGFTCFSEEVCNENIVPTLNDDGSIKLIFEEKEYDQQWLDELQAEKRYTKEQIIKLGGKLLGRLERTKKSNWGETFDEWINEIE